MKLLFIFVLLAFGLTPLVVIPFAEETLWVFTGLSHLVVVGWAYLLTLPLVFLEWTHMFYVDIPTYLISLHATLLASWEAFKPIEILRQAVLCPAPRTLFFVYTMPQTRYCFLVNGIFQVSPELSGFDLTLILLLSLGVVALAYVQFGLSTTVTCQALVMGWLNRLSTAPRLRPEHVRSTFNDAEFCRMKPVANHSHGSSAADRSSASAFADRFGPLLGLTPYFIQRSRADERKGRQGSRTHFWSKDLNAVEQEFEYFEDSLFVLVDVDQYLDMPALLCDLNAPTLLYTFQPDQVSKTTPEYSYTFMEGNVVDYKVTGSGSFQHEVWNYSHDNLIVTKTFCGIPYKLVSFMVERRRTSPDHEMIVLIPLRTWKGIGAALTSLFLSGSPLARLRVVHGRFLRLMVAGVTQGLCVSTGKVGEYAQATVPVEVDNTLATISSTGKYDITLTQTTSLLDGDKVGGAVLLDYHREGTVHKPDVVCPLADSIRVYQFKPNTYDPSDKCLLTAFMSPLLGDCFVPTNSLSSELTAVEERVVKPRPPLLTLTPFLVGVMHEFINFLIPEAHQLDPVDEEYVYDKQSRPTQRRIFEVSQGCEPKRVVQSFLKKESYGKPAAPRVISTINGVDKLAYSRYIYSLVDNVLKPQDWYAFGKTPMEIAQRVADICSSAAFACNSDFKKFDGHGSNVMREFERLILLQAFRPCHHDELMDLHQSQYGLKAYTTGGVEYNTEYSRASGSAETAAFNGLVNAFTSYLEGRLSLPDGSFYTPRDAWNRLGIYGGDDGLTADVDIPNYQRAAKCIGQEVTTERVPRGQRGVMFLARVYSPFVWEGDLNTCCDLPRQLTKLHVSVTLPSNVTPVMKLLEKCRSYWLTDANTPILGDFVERARFLLNGEFEANPATAPMRAWGSDFPRDKQYVNERHEWMDDYVSDCLPDADLKRFNAWLAGVLSLQDMLSPPILREPVPAKSELPVVVDGMTVPIIPLLVKKKPAVEAPRAKMTPEEFEEYKKKKVQEGTWVEKPNDKSKAQSKVTKAPLRGRSK